MRVFDLSSNVNHHRLSNGGRPGDRITEGRALDGPRFDALTRRLGTRRTALGGLLAVLLVPLEAAARGKGTQRGKQKGKHRDKGKGKDKSRSQNRTHAQAEQCWRAGACIPKKGSNVSQCNLANYSPATTLDCTGCNISRANLRGATLSGANLTKANLSGACLVDADFTDATLANNTNLYNAIFCRTTMPDGSVNNSGCTSGTPCCPTCDTAHLCASGCCNMAAGTCGACPGGSTCGGGNPGIPGICGCTPATCQSLGKQCGSWPDGCGQTLTCGPCTSGQVCLEQGTCCTPETCASLGKTCGRWPDSCGGLTPPCGGCHRESPTPSCDNGTCAACSSICPDYFDCINPVEGSSFCSDHPEINCTPACRSNADCPATHPICALSFTSQGPGVDPYTFPLTDWCPSNRSGVCINLRSQG